mgnify:CR=1 FL=1
MKVLYISNPTFQIITMEMNEMKNENENEEVWCDICCLRVLKDNANCITYQFNELEKTHLWECPSCWEVVE